MTDTHNSSNQDDNSSVHDGGATSDSSGDSGVKEGIQTPGGLPDWLVNATIEDLTSPLMKREAPLSGGERRA